jgi:hypothetical protein
MVSIASGASPFVGQALLRYIPKREGCTPEAVRAAYRFLTGEWLIDVMTDRKGKAALIAYALSVIERCLIPERPVYTVTAGQRGGGKTTVLMMIALAVLGVKPAAAAWSSDPTERKKALFSYLREGLPTLIWGNIPRGAAISCPSKTEWRNETIPIQTGTAAVRGFET